MSTTNSDDQNTQVQATKTSTDTQSPPPDEIRELAADVRKRGFDELAAWLDDRAEETQEVPVDG